MSVPASKSAPEPQQRSFWIAVICGAVILTIGIGARQSFGIFQKPVHGEFVNYAVIGIWNRPWQWGRQA
jgi:hypothetical protein